MSNLLDDHSEEQLAEEQLEQVRVLALVFVAKCLVALFFKLQTTLFIININYVWWVLIGLEVVAVQRALSAFYRWKDRGLIQYLRLFYIGVGFFCLNIALMYMDWAEEALYLYHSYQWLLIFLDVSVSLLLVRYYFNRLESPQYWLFMENLLWWCWGLVLLYRMVVYAIYNFAATTFMGNSTFLVYVSHFFRGVLVLAAVGCGLAAYKKIYPHNKLLALLSLMAVICWILGIYFEYQHRMLLELLLFVGTILAVLAYASSFSHSSKEEK